MTSSLHMLSFRNSKKGVGGKMTVKVNWWDRPKKKGRIGKKLLRRIEKFCCNIN